MAGLGWRGVFSPWTPWLEEGGVTGWQPGEAGVGAGAMARISEGRVMDLAGMTRRGGFGLWIMEIDSPWEERGSYTFKVPIR